MISKYYIKDNFVMSDIGTLKLKRDKVMSCNDLCGQEDLYEIPKHFTKYNIINPLMRIPLVSKHRK